MGFAEQQGFCSACNRKTLIRQQTPNHILHLLITLGTCGFWAIIWLFLVAFGEPWRCHECGHRVRSGTSPAALVGLILINAIFLLGVVLMAMAGDGISVPDANAAEQGDALIAVVVKVVDGDTLIVTLGGVRDCVRLRNEDAPELHEPGGEEARAALAQRFPPDSTVYITVYARDAYGRIIGTVEAQ